ncbi:MAG: double-strand break repair protein AddB [Hyphomicrobiales bacterium]
MTAARPRLLNIPADADFLTALAAAVDRGDLPVPCGKPPLPHELPHWTILVPNRRAARALSEAFLATSASGARLLPRIRPIGDIDEDFLGLIEQPSPDDALLAPAISLAGREFLLLSLIADWARDNSHEALSHDLAQSPAHRIGFAESLAQLIDKIETEGKDLLDLAALYDIDLATHRQTLIGLLGTIRDNYPLRLAELGLMDPTARRNALIRHQARTLLANPPTFPVIAAGSTGSIPATAELLRVIASLDRGAVILPGLDTEMDKASWEALTPQQAQYGLKTLLETLKADRGEVELLPGVRSSPRGEARRWLASEIMRPAETASGWRDVVSRHSDKLLSALDGLTFCPMRSRREEAAAIALILRGAIEEQGKTASLITPDRELARRVIAALRRWNIEAHDSAGEPLSTSLPGGLVRLLIDAALSGFDPVSLAALLHHPLLHLGADGEEVHRHLELAVLRSAISPKRIEDLSKAAQAARKQAETDSHLHSTVKRLSAEDWDKVEVLAQTLAAMLLPIARQADRDGSLPFKEHAEALLEALDQLTAADAVLWSGRAGQALAELFASLLRDSDLHPPCRFAEAMLMLARHLRTTAVASPVSGTARITILGLLEARLLRSDVTVLGGLNEGKWPAQSDPGPWVNRPMRNVLGMQMPERDIGMTAHDFAQALGSEQVFITWSERVGGAPAVPSRWVVTAQMLMTAAFGAKPSPPETARWAAELDAPVQVIPVGKPKALPPVATRPTRFSVTEIEKLIRDPYAIYAKKILRLEPLPDLLLLERHAMRGTVIHDALDQYALLRRDSGVSALDAMREAGRRVFAAHRDDPEIMGFWLPRFERVAEWFAREDELLRLGVASSLTEKRGSTLFTIGAREFSLSARADRIDLFESGAARIIDYKTGQVPSRPAVEAGFKPQLTLEAAILARDGFGLGRGIATQELVYVRLSGGEPPGEIKDLGDLDVMTVAEKHFEELQVLLAEYEQPQQAYLPALAMERQADRGDYDHLARFDEWALSGGDPP